MKLEELNVYTDSMELADSIWNILQDWDYFHKDTIGKQLIRAADSIAANISEGFGRYHFRDKTNFLYFSRGSLFETKTWLTKAFRRKLIDNKAYSNLLERIDALGVKLNNYINSTRSNS